MDSPLRPKKLSDEYYSFNEGFSNEISSQDRSELLDILNSKRYAQRVIAPTELRDSDLRSVAEELSVAAEEQCLRGEISERALSEQQQLLAQQFQETRVIADSNA